MQRTQNQHNEWNNALIKPPAPTTLLKLISPADLVIRNGDAGQKETRTSQWQNCSKQHV